MTEISQNDFNFYQALLKEKSGLALTEAKTYLLSSRLTPVATSLGYASLEDFTKDMRSGKDPSLSAAAVEAMTTNETSFFRDTKPFETFKTLLPEIMQSREIHKKIRIWSAACSSGQEAYSIAMTLDEFFADKPGWQYEIVGTDISESMLEQARRGEYSQFEIQRGLTIQAMVKYFDQSGTKWKIKDRLKSAVRFQYANLLDNIGSLGSFDFIFCRNVLIYFNSETKTQVLNEIGHHMREDSYLFLGACETAINLQVPLAPVSGQHGVLRRVAAQAVKTG